MLVELKEVNNNPEVNNIAKLSAIEIMKQEGRDAFDPTLNNVINEYINKFLLSKLGQSHDEIESMVDPAYWLIANKPPNYLKEKIIINNVKESIRKNFLSRVFEFKLEVLILASNGEIREKIGDEETWLDPDAISKLKSQIQCLRQSSMELVKNYAVLSTEIKPCMTFIEF